MIPERMRRISRASRADRLMSRRTTTAIAHCAHTVRSSDRIIVSEDGRMMESGPHHELTEHGGPSASLYRNQTGSHSGTQAVVT